MTKAGTVRFRGDECYVRDNRRRWARSFSDAADLPTRTSSTRFIGRALSRRTRIFPPERYPFPDNEMRAHWLPELEGGEATTAIAERDGLAVGFVVVSPGWLRSLFVRASEWGRGAGSALHGEAVELLEAGGAGASLWVLEQNEQARAFYEHRGWRHDGERGRSPFPPFPPVLRYVLDFGGGGGDPIPSPHPPRGCARD